MDTRVTEVMFFEALAVGVVLALAGDRTRLVKAARVEQSVQPLAHVVPPGRVLARDTLFATHALRQLLAPAQLVELGLPAHGGDAIR